MKNIGTFLGAFVLNVIWENLHSVLYVHYKNGPIIELVFVRAALLDAVLIVVIVWIAKYFSRTIPAPVCVLFLGLIVAIVIEYWARGTGRWAYAASMPIIPILGIGLTPAIQFVSIGILMCVIREK